MACAIAFGLLYPNHEFAAIMVSPPNILIAEKIAVKVANMSLFSLCVLETLFSTNHIIFHFPLMPESVTRCCICYLDIYLSCCSHAYSTVRLSCHLYLMSIVL